MAPSSNNQFRRSGQRNDRRRRFFSDGNSGRRSGAAQHPAFRDPIDRRSDNYGDAEFMDEQLRLTDLVPRRLITFGLIMLAGFAIIGGLEALYSWMPQLAANTTDSSIAAFDLDAEGSLATWYSSLLLLLAACAAVLVYMVRRHKMDDYQGNYRVWLWAAMCWVLMSIDESSSLHEGFKEMMAYATGSRVIEGSDGSIWWVVPYFFLLGAVGSRLLADMRECKLSTAAFLTTAVCYAVAVVTQLGWIMPESGARGVMLEEGLEMTGNLMLLTAMALHARYVILDAEGLLPRREEKEEEIEREPVSSGSRWMSDEPHGVPEPASSQLAGGLQTASASVGRKLTKQERKALRKKLARERQQRERKQHQQWGG